ncbi:MAG: HipA domain-containing protein [Deltaproteobacteria bacterium]|nr:HipA domain-containing protein [Deltaproteobacteria bacterium]
MAASGAALPLAIGDGRSRLSLAGAQDKLPVLVEGEAILLPEGDAPSSHILKLPNRDFAHLPANEVLVSMLARAVGLRVPDARLVALGQERACLVRRYDRRRGDDGKLVRIHQEDLCQALGLGHATKYEQEGGPSLVDCFELVSRASAEPLTDCEQLLRWQAFNAAVGNADGHAKNLSLVLEGRIIRLAPFYDLVCTRAYPGLDRRLAMRVGEVADPGQIRGRDWSRLADAIGVGRRYLLDLVREMVGSVRASLDESAEDFREHYGDSPAVQMVVGAVRAQALRLSEQLSVD